MSRRKQAYPKPFGHPQVAEGEINQVNKEIQEYPQEHDIDEDDDEFRPLVIDTSMEHSNSIQALSMEQIPPVEQTLQSNSTEKLPVPTMPSSSQLELSATIASPDSHNNSASSDPENTGSPCGSIYGDNMVLNGVLAGNSRRATGKGSAPYKTRRKDDRIQPVADNGCERFICPVCQQVLGSASDLTRHIRSHNTTAASNINTCTICGKILSSQSSLDRHMLVHSGERPFECSHCKMSFTTNGNMHRHMRIHEKESGGIPSSSHPGTPSREFPTTPRSQLRAQSKLHQSPISQHDTKNIPLSPQYHNNSALLALKRKFETSPDEVASKKLVPAEGLAAMALAAAAQFTDISATPNRKPLQVSPRTKVYVKKEITSSEQYSCPVCNTKYYTTYGLESHMAECHPDLAHICPDCCMVFHSARGLQVHQVMVHRPKAQARTSEQINGVQMNGVSSVPGIGFHELDYVAFSTNKFTEVARAWCEKNQRRPSSCYHDFTCVKCHHAFPSRGALKLHMEMHSPEKPTTCQECDITFSSHQAYKSHITQHKTAEIVQGYAKHKGADDNDLQDSVSKPEFLLVLGLKTKKDSQSGIRNETNTDRRDLKINRDYYVKTEEARWQRENPQSDETQALKNPQVKVERKEGMSQALLEQLQSPILATLPNHSANPRAIVDPPTENLTKYNFSHNTNILQTSLTSKMQISTLQKELMKPKVSNSLIYSSSQHTPSISLPKQEMGLLSYHNGPIIDEDVISLPDDESLYSLEGGTISDRDERDGTHACKFCEEIFPNYRALKSHERIHMGLTPYQCNLCSYSSTDKSTLIRHLRTHNGDRPFQCLLCRFAFTTKANCERHVKKRHNKHERQEVEAVIGYNQAQLETKTEDDFFASPDTVCKYCGEDFKFFRALKHHLRSHSSCRSKPFMCILCSSGFSTKANCMRHIPKQHPEVEQTQIESHIIVNELQEPVDGLQPSHQQFPTPQHPNFLASTPVMQGKWPASTFLGQSPIISQPNLLQTLYATPSPRIRPPGLYSATSPSPFIPRSLSESTYITTPPTSDIKLETRDSGFDQPLDFSMRSQKTIKPAHSGPSSNTPTYQGISPADNDAPMDLTMKRVKTEVIQSTFSRSNSPPPSSSNQNSQLFHPMKLPVVVNHMTTSPPPMNHLSQSDFGMLRYKKDYQKFYNPALGRLQCPFCKMIFKHGLKLLVHIRSHTNERPYQCDLCSASFTIKTNLDRHRLTRHPEEAHEGLGGTFEGGINPSLYLPDFNPQIIKESNNNIPKVYDHNSTKDRPMIFGNGTTNLNDSKSPVSSDSELASITRILDATNPVKFQGFLNKRGPSPTPESVAIPFVTRGSSPPVNLMVRSLSEGFTISNKEPERCETPVSQQRSITPNTDPSSVNADGDDQLDGLDLTNDQTEGGKRKRNSYADSPHKLQCPYCPRAFPWISSLKRHILTHTGQKPFKCPQCPVTFSTKSNRERHMIRKHGLNVHDPATRQMMDRPYKCHLCVFSSFASAGNLLRHYKERHPEHEMPASDALHLSLIDGATGDSYSNTSDLSPKSSAINNFTDNEEVDDELGSEGFAGELGDHSSRTSPAFPLLAPSPTVHPPRSITPSPVPHQHPILETTPDRHINPERDNYNVDKITECWKCDLVFDTRKGLLRHLKEHNVDLPFKCYLCDASFDTRIESLEHKLSRHPADYDIIKEKNKIRDCQHFSKALDNLVQEMLAGNVPSKNDLDLGDDKPESDYAQRKVYCSLCIKRFWSLQDLRRHMRSHTGERPFECDVCQARFTLKHSMMRHRRKHGDTDGASVLSDDDSTTTLDDHTDHYPTGTRLNKNGTNESSSVLGKVNGPQQENGTTNLLGSDLLHNLLGVETSTIDKMLESGVDGAAKMLGM